MFEIHALVPEQTHRLRHTVLRPHQRLDEMIYDGDTLPSTLHLGAFRQGDPTQVLGIVTLSNAPMPGGPAEGDVRLRGMAVDPSVQGLGVGRLLVQRSLVAAADRGAKRMWCNARVTAMGFYQKLGFVTRGDEFQIAGIGPHYLMHIALDSSPR